jgi:protein-disulfide isomerase
MRSALALIPLLALAACGGGAGGDNATPAASESPVATVAPPAGTNWADTVTKTAEGWVLGNPNAPIKLVEYGSRTCPTCGRFSTDAMEPLKQKYISTGRVSYEWRDFPLHGAPDLALGLLNQCMPTPSFFAMLEQMFANQQQFLERQQQLPPAAIQQLQTMTPPQAAVAMADGLGIVDFVKQRGLPEAQARQCLNDQAAIQRMADGMAKATNEMGVNGTPTFFINGEKLEAAMWSQVEPALRAAGAR